MTPTEACELVGRALVASGIDGRGSVFRLRGADVQWVVEIERIAFRRRIGVGIGLDLQSAQMPELPTTCPIMLPIENLEPFRGSAMVAALALDARLDDRAALVAALDMESNLEDEDRRNVLETAARTVAEYLMARSTLVAVRHAYRAGDFAAGFVHKDARAAFED